MSAAFLYLISPMYWRYERSLRTVESRCAASLLGSALNLNIKSEAQQKKLKTVRGSYKDLDLSIHAKKGSEKYRDTLPLRMI